MTLSIMLLLLLSSASSLAPPCCTCSLSAAAHPLLVIQPVQFLPSDCQLVTTVAVTACRAASPPRRPGVAPDGVS